MVIKIFGPGCKNCLRVAENARAAIAQLGLDATIEKVENIQEFIKAGVFRTPGVAFDNEIICQGMIPSTEKLKDWLQKYLATKH